MRFLNSVLVLTILFSVAVSNLIASDGRFTIIESGERTFLLDTDTGATWRYFFNNIEKQGWSREYIISLGEKEDTYNLRPYGEEFKVSKQK